jgi:serine/threonine protein kinase
MNYRKEYLNSLLNGHFSTLPSKDKLCINSNEYLYNSNDLKNQEGLGSSKYPVYSYYHESSGVYVAEKRIPICINEYYKNKKNIINRRKQLLKKIMDENVNKIKKELNEIRIMEILSTKNPSLAVNFYGWSINDETIRIFMEQMPFSLQNIINQIRVAERSHFIIPPDFHIHKHVRYWPFSQAFVNKKKFIYSLAAIGIIKGLYACHEADICHGDIKPANILVDRNGNFKLADFGESICVNDVKKGFTLHYLPPEDFAQNHDKLDSRKKDVWCLGMLLEDFVFYFEGFSYSKDDPKLANRTRKAIDPYDYFKYINEMKNMQQMYQIPQHDIGALYENIKALCLTPYENRPTIKELISGNYFKLLECMVEKKKKLFEKVIESLQDDIINEKNMIFDPIYARIMDCASKYSKMVEKSSRGQNMDM